MFWLENEKLNFGGKNHFKFFYRSSWNLVPGVFELRTCGTIVSCNLLVALDNVYHFNVLNQQTYNVFHVATFRNTTQFVDYWYLVASDNMRHSYFLVAPVMCFMKIFDWHQTVVLLFLYFTRHVKHSVTLFSVCNTMQYVIL